jgi:hypothetical protein
LGKNKNKKTLQDTPCQKPVAGHSGTQLSSQAMWEAEKIEVPVNLGKKKFARPHLNGKS